MRKSDLVSAIAKDTGISSEDVLAVVESFTENVKKAVSKDDPVTIRGFGTFMPKIRKEKIGQNISRGIPIIIPECKIPFFRPSKKFSNLLK